MGFVWSRLFTPSSLSFLFCKVEIRVASLTEFRRRREIEKELSGVMALSSRDPQVLVPSSHRLGLCKAPQIKRGGGLGLCLSREGKMAAYSFV